MISELLEAGRERTRTVKEGDIGDQVRQLSDLVRDAERGLAGLDPMPWARRLEESYPELDRSLHWLIDRQRFDDALQLCISLVDFWMSSGRLRKGERGSGARWR
jgi:hypothetical protein